MAGLESRSAIEGNPQSPLRSPRGLWSIAAVAASLVLLLSGLSTPPLEYQVKAVFLFHFTQFVEWPLTAFSDPASPLVIGILGEDPFGNFIDETVRGETVQGRPIAIQRYTRPEDVGEVHVLFISNSEQQRLESTLAQVRGRSILTVGEGEEFAARGVMIRFRNVQNRVRLSINVDALRAEGLSASSRLLRSAEIVQSAAVQARP